MISKYEKKNVTFMCLLDQKRLSKKIISELSHKKKVTDSFFSCDMSRK